MVWKRSNCFSTPRIYRLTCALFVLATTLTGCASDPVNPSFPTQLDAAKDDLKRIEASPQPLDRPLVVISGFLDPGISSSWLKAEFSALTTDRRIVAVDLFDCGTLQECREKIVKAVDKSFSNDSKEATLEVDVIGVSLGGLAARYASGPTGQGKKLKIARLFTISSPLRGAKLAEDLPLLIPFQAELRPGSPEMTALNRWKEAYPTYSYICLGDDVIGDQNAAVAGRTAWWLTKAPMADVHGGAFYDARILADITRRLRHEPALATDPPADLPVRS